MHHAVQALSAQGSSRSLSQSKVSNSNTESNSMTDTLNMQEESVRNNNVTAELSSSSNHVEKYFDKEG